MTTLSVSDETAEVLRTLEDQAKSRGLPLEAYLRSLAEAGELPSTNGRLSPSELDQYLEDLSSGLPPLSTLPEGFSRADLYSDHD